jgi:hypothetical protein
MRRRFQTGEVLDSGVAFDAGRLGTSVVAAGPAPLPFHGPYIAQEMVARSSPGVLRLGETRRNTSAVMKTALGSAPDDSGHCPPVSRVMHECGDLLRTLSLPRKSIPLHGQKPISESGSRSALKTELRYRGQINTRADMSLIRLVGPTIEVARAESLA